MIRVLIIITFFLSSQNAFADEQSDKTDFKKLYAEFNDLYTNSKEIDPIIEVAEKLYKLAPRVYGKNDPNTAVVTYNLASLYDEKGGNTNSDDEKKAVELYEDYFRILDKNKTPKDQNYFSQFISLVYAENNANGIKSKNKTSEKAIEIAEEIHLPNKTIADYEYNFALLRFKRGQPYEAEGFFQSSLDKYKAEFDENHFKVGEILFWLAKIDMGKSKKTSAEEKFLEALDIFDQNNNEKEKELAQHTHAFLVNLYEDMGKSDEATKHCRAIAVERPKDFDAYIDPLYRAPPNYPTSAAKSGKEGYVLLEFNVDEDGITRDIEILESSSNIFEKSSTEAAAKFRYAPSVQDGKLIPTKGVRVRVEYNIAN